MSFVFVRRNAGSNFTARIDVIEEEDVMIIVACNDFWKKKCPSNWSWTNIPDKTVSPRWRMFAVLLAINVRHFEKLSCRSKYAQASDQFLDVLQF